MLARSTTGSPRKIQHATPRTWSTVVPGFTNTGWPSTKTSIWLLAAVAVVRPESHGKRKQKLSVTARCKPSDPTLLILQLYSTDRTWVLERAQRRIPELWTTHAYMPFSKLMSHTWILSPYTHAWTRDTYHTLWRTGRPQLRSCGQQAVEAWCFGKRGNSTKCLSVQVFADRF